MNHRRWHWLLLAGIGLLLTAALAPAQERGRGPGGNKGYIRFPDEGDLKQALADKLTQQQFQMDLAKALEKLGQQGLPFKLGPSDLKGFDLQDPKFKKQVEQILSQHKDKLKLDPEQIRALQRALKDLPPLPKEIKPPEGGPPALDKPPVSVGKAPPQPPKGVPPRPPTSATKPESSMEDKLADWAKTMAKRLENTRLGEKLAESPAWRRGMQDLQGMLSDRIGSKLPFPDQDLARLGDRLKLPANLDFALPDLSGLKIPKVGVPSIPRPNLNLSMPSLGGGPRPSAPSLGAPSGGALALGTGLLWGGLALLVLLLLWRLLRRAGGAARPAAASGWRLGQWPVDLAKIANREELIRAFEHLALLYFGLDARSWNHREIAAGLAGQADTTEARRHAADELAWLYEQARYAPAGEPFSGAELADARRHLCYLAGVATA
jgi:hypothetical protein